MDNNEKPIDTDDLRAPLGGHPLSHFDKSNVHGRWLKVYQPFTSVASNREASVLIHSFDRMVSRAGGYIQRYSDSTIIRIGENTVQAWMGYVGKNSDVPHKYRMVCRGPCFTETQRESRTLTYVRLAEAIRQMQIGRNLPTTGE